MKPNFELSLLVLFGLLLVHTIAQLRLGQHISHIDFQKLSKFNIEPGITVSGLSAGELNRIDIFEEYLSNY